MDEENRDSKKSLDNKPNTEQKLLIYRTGEQILADLNGGKLPTRFREWKKLGDRFDIHYHIIPGLQSAGLIYNTNAEAGDLFLPDIRDRRLLHLWILHEAIEFLYAREVSAAFVYPWFWGDHHDMARIVDIAYSQKYGARLEDRVGWRGRYNAP